MQELDILKQDWKKSETEYKQFSSEELYRMIHKNSNSVVKWLLIISIIEIIFWILLTNIHSIITLITGDVYLEEEKNPDWSYKIGYYLGVFYKYSKVLILIFGILLFIQFKRIKNSKTARDLMMDILRVKNIVNWYINFFAYSTYILFFTSIFFTLIKEYHFETMNEENIFKIGFVLLFCLLPIVIFIYFIKFIYHLIYGKMIEKLEKNYKELKSLE